MRQDRKSKNNIDKLRKILDDPRDPNTKKIISSDEQHLESLQKRLTGDMKKPAVTPLPVRSTKKPAPFAPTVVVYKREEKKPLEIKKTVPEKLPEFTSVEEEKLPVFKEVSPQKETNIHLQQPTLVNEELFEPKDLFEVEKIDSVAPEFLEVRPQIRISPSRKNLQEFQEVIPAQEYTATEPLQKVDEHLPEWEPVVDEGKPGKPTEPLHSFTEVTSPEEPPTWERVQEKRITEERPEQIPLEKQKKKQEQKQIKQLEKERKREENKAKKLVAKQVKLEARKQKQRLKLETQKQKDEARKAQQEQEQRMEELTPLSPVSSTPWETAEEEVVQELPEKTALEKQKEKLARQQTKKLEQEQKRNEKEAKKRTKHQAKLEGQKQKQDARKKLREQEQEEVHTPPEPMHATESVFLQPAIDAFKGLKSVDEKTALILYNNGYFSVDDLKKATMNDLTTIRGIKRKQVKQIKKELENKESVAEEKPKPPKPKKRAAKTEVEEETEWKAYHVDEIRLVESVSDYCTYGAYTLYKRDIVRVGGKKTTIHFFSKEKPTLGESTSIPEGYRIAINKKTGVPYLKKKR